MIRAAHIVWPRTTKLSRTLHVARALRSILLSMGFQAKLTSTQPQHISEGDLLISPSAMKKRDWATTIFFCMEPFRNPNKPGPYANQVRRMRRWCTSPSRWFDAIFCHDVTTMMEFQQFDVPAFLVPIGYHESFEVHRPAHIWSEGVFFIGSQTGMRNEIVTACGGRYVTRRDAVKACLHAPGIHLAIHAGAQSFDSVRIVSLLLANKRCVLSDTMARWSPLVPERHYYVASHRYMPHVCRDLMANPDLRNVVAQKGHEYVKTRFRLDDYLKAALREAGVLEG